MEGRRCAHLGKPEGIIQFGTLGVGGSKMDEITEEWRKLHN
jgi:hypothetical protein